MYSCGGNRISFTLQQTLGSCVTGVLLMGVPHHVWALEKPVFHHLLTVFMVQKAAPSQARLTAGVGTSGQSCTSSVSQFSSCFPPLPKSGWEENPTFFHKCELQHSIKNSSWTSYSLCINTLLFFMGTNNFQPLANAIATMYKSHM